MKTLITIAAMLLTVSASAQTTDKALHKENGFSYVDIGLPSHTMWAGKNLGASNVTRGGNYFAWGETKSKRDYSWATYKYTSDKTSDGICKYQFDDLKDKKNEMQGKKWYEGGAFSGDGKTQLELDDDPVHAIMGGSWHTPTWEQWNELIENTTQTWVDDFRSSGMSGFIFQSKTNKSGIFFPAAGNMEGMSGSDDGSMGYYWTASMIGKKVLTITESGTEAACGVNLYDGGIFFEYFNKYKGFSVRGVCEIK